MNWGMVHGPDGVGRRRAAVRRTPAGPRLPGVLGVSAGVASAAQGVAGKLGLIAEAPWPMMTCARDRISAGGRARCRSRSAGGTRAGEAALTAACDVMGAGFGLAGWKCGNMLGPRFLEQADADLFLATLEGVPAAAAGTGRVGDFVGIYAVATAPELRRRGAASAAVSAAIAYHLDRGAQLFGLMASEAGAQVYSRLGFATVELTPVWSVEAA